jgi:hypothetical protein
MVLKSVVFRRDYFTGSSVSWKAEQTDNRETFALTIQIRTDPVGRGRKKERVRIAKHSASLTYGCESGFRNSCRILLLLI